MRQPHDYFTDDIIVMATGVTIEKATTDFITLSGKHLDNKWWIKLNKSDSR